MEVIAGEPDCNTIVVIFTQKEGNCKFYFDFAEVYWNSKLSAERDRVLALINPNDVICDVFAGVGPFSIRAAKKGCKVIANDLNPASYKFLIENAYKNKVANKVAGFNIDAREFLTKFLMKNREDALEFRDLPLTFSHLYMNLPMDALEFLDVLKGKFERDVWTVLPMVHVYGFAHIANAEILIQRIKEVWGEFDTSGIKVTRVRDVSPRKFMFCLEFVIPEDIAFVGNVREIDEEEEKIQKKRKIQE